MAAEEKDGYIWKQERAAREMQEERNEEKPATAAAEAQSRMFTLRLQKEWTGSEKCYFHSNLAKLHKSTT